MADRESAANLREHIFRENIGDQTHGLVHARSQAVGSGYSSRFLSAVLQSMQAEISELLRFRMGKDRHHAAFIVKFVGFQHLAFSYSLLAPSSEHSQSAATISRIGPQVRL